VKRLSIFLILAITFSIFLTPTAKAAPDTAVVSPDHIAALRSIPSDSVVHITFTETRSVQALDRDITSEGWLLYKPGVGLLRVVSEPFKNVRFIGVDGTVVRKTREGDIRRMKADRMGDAGQFFTAFIHLLEGDLDELSRYFHVESERDDGAWTLTLTPENSSSATPFERLTVRGREAIESVTVDAGSGNLIRTQYHRRVTRSRLTDEERAVFRSISVSLK
jgi:hypothetical protein